MAFTFPVLEPEFGDSLTQETGLEAFHSPQPLTPIVMAPDDAAAGAEMWLVETVRTHWPGDEAPACESMTTCPAMVSVATREVAPLLAVALYVTLPFATPDAGLRISQELDVDAFHEQPA